MKFFHENKNNKGVAMITVLITITFLGILASSLMYMAYMNYLTKTVRYRSTDNFYTDEMALDEISAKLQQIAASVSGNSNANAIKAIGTAVGASGGKYDPAKVAALATNTKAEGVTVTVETAAADCIFNAASNNSKVTLENVILKTVSVAEDYSSTITTDITIVFKSPSSTGVKLNEFSIIADDWINLSVGSHVYEGNLYLENKNVTKRYFGLGTTKKTPKEVGSYTYSTPLDASKYCSVWLHHGNDAIATCTLSCPAGILVGDIVIQDQSALNIAGKVAVFGNIYVNKNCLLSVTGDVSLYGKLYYKDKKDIIGIDNIKEEAIPDSAWESLCLEYDEEEKEINGKKETVKKYTGANGLANSIYADYFVHGDSTNGGDKWFMQSVDMFELRAEEGDKSKRTTSVSEVYAKFGNPNGTVVHGDDLNNSLTILYRNPSGANPWYTPPVTGNEGYLIHGGNLSNSTIITKFSLNTSDGQVNDAFTGHMTDVAYDAACYTTFQPANKENASEAKQIPSVDVTFPDAKKKTGKKSVMIGGVEKEITYTYYDIADIEFEYATSDVKTNTYKAKYKAASYANEDAWLEQVYKWRDSDKTGAKYDIFAVDYGYKDSDGKDVIRWYVYDKTDGTNILPFGYLLGADAEKIVADVFSGVFQDGVEDPSYSYVIYSNWIKD